MLFIRICAMSMRVGYEWQAHSARPTVVLTPAPTNKSCHRNSSSIPLLAPPCRFAQQGLFEVDLWLSQKLAMAAVMVESSSWVILLLLGGPRGARSGPAEPPEGVVEASGATKWCGP